ncbi:hypothetical protein PT2222_180133 [Paraburkholderia tropica]
MCQEIYVSLKLLFYSDIKHLGYLSYS